MRDPTEKKPAAGKSKTRPNIVHPTIPGAVGSMESPYRDGRDTDEESKLIIEDTIKQVTGKNSKA